MSKYKVGDKVLLEAEVLNVNSDSNVIFPYYLGLKNDASYHCAEKDIECISKTYEDGLADAWELVKKLYKMRKDKLYTIFDTDYPLIRNLIDDFTPQEVITKIEAYEESKVIKVGDVVVNINQEKLLVTKTLDNGYFEGINEYGSVYTFRADDTWKKTGRHIDITSILEQIRGNE